VSAARRTDVTLRDEVWSWRGGRGRCSSDAIQVPLAMVVIEQLIRRNQRSPRLGMARQLSSDPGLGKVRSELA
jgi:hypothetical protein